MEEHVNDNYIDLTRTQGHHKVSMHELVIFGQDVILDIMIVGENVSIIPELISQVFVLFEKIGGVKFISRSSIEDAFPQVLTQTSTKVEQGVSRLEARQDHGVIEWMLGQAEAEEPEFSHTRPGEDTPGFVALICSH